MRYNKFLIEKFIQLIRSKQEIVNNKKDSLDHYTLRVQYANSAVLTETFCRIKTVEILCTLFGKG